MLNIAVIFGGKSVEHDISIITGTLTLNTLDKTKFNAIPIYVDKKGLWWTCDCNTLKAFSNFNSKKASRVTLKIGEEFLYKIKGNKLKVLAKVDCVINCTHGYNGEDGTISGLIKLCNIALASPNEFCSSFAMDKEYTKIVLKGLGIKTLNYKILRREDYVKDGISCIKNLGKINYPVIIKPARLGSSIGIETASDFKALNIAIEKSFKYDDKLLIEPLIKNFTEINCAVYKGEKTVVSNLEKPITSSEILSFEDKYNGNVEREFPANIDKELEEKIKTISKKVYESLNFSGIIRIDFIVKDENVYLNEINTIPGSLAYYLFCNTFAEFSITLQKLIDRAVKNKIEFNKNLFCQHTEVLSEGLNLKK